MLFFITFCLGLSGLLWAQDSGIYCDEEGHCWYQGENEGAEQKSTPTFNISDSQGPVNLDSHHKLPDENSYYSDDPYSRQVRAEDRYERERLRMQEEQDREVNMNRAQGLNSLSQGNYGQIDTFDRVSRDKY